MPPRLDGKTIAILVDHGFEQATLVEPKRALDEAGAETSIISPSTNVVNSWDRNVWGDAFSVDVPLQQANPDNYDGLLLPGGAIHADALRRNRAALSFIRAFFDAGRPVAAIGEAQAALANLGIANRYTLTSAKSARQVLEQAGATWVNREATADRGLVTSRMTKDLPAFILNMLEQFAGGRSR